MMEIKADNTINVPPKAAALSESMRGLGYSLETAVADIVDNSIAAGAKKIVIAVRPAAGNLPARVEIADDGCGMTRAELIEAMSLGSMSPEQKRRTADLGRFGLGLKTASFSQARRLSVTSRKNGECSAFVWDLDHLAKTDQWDLIEEAPQEDALNKAVGSGSGTLVCWEKPDRILWLAAEVSKPERNQALVHLKKHLELTFHRFLQDGDFSLWLNGARLKGWDPFFTNDPKSPKTYPEEKIRLNGSTVKVHPFVIPLPENRSQGGASFGEDDDLELQGFFLYRGKRLISQGGWLGLRDMPRRREFSLARICVDFSNDSDSLWRLDVRKSIARPPQEVRKRFKYYAMWTRLESAGVLGARRPATPAGSENCSMWKKRSGSGPVPDAADPVVAVMTEALASGELNAELVQGWLEILAAAHPSVEKRAAVARSPQIDAAAAFIYEKLRKGCSAETAQALLMRRRPFKEWNALMNAIFKGTD